jgi:WD40 repeat protein
VVTVLSHGDLAETGELYVVGSSGGRHRDTRVGDWIREAEDLAGRPRTLFLLDLCQAGVVAHDPHLLAPGGRPRRSWALAACPPDRAAFDGRFTQALTNTLAAFTGGRREIHSAQRYLPLTTLAADSKRELERLVDVSDAYPQEAVGSLIDLTQAEETPPFFPNPAHRPDAAVPRARGAGARTPDAFLEEIDALADPGHFMARASGHGRAVARLRSGCFTGRAPELLTLSRWLDGRDEGALRVVTGAPGSGKSALLGVLVCAAHPLLREPTESLWVGTGHSPSRNEALAVVHARQRDAASVLASLVRQLEPAAAEGGSGDRGGIRDWAGLRRALRRRAEPPVVIVDALDEAARPVDLAARLLALVPACRLLVGTRPWPEFGALLDAARAEHGLIDLDDRPAFAVRADLRGYVQAMLALSPPYDGRAYAPVREAFATAVADTLSPDTHPTGVGGEFLVASLYVHRLLARRVPVGTPEDAAALGRRVPRTLPKVLELDLASNPDLRPILRTLATARGEGMPVEAVRAVLPLFTPEGEHGDAAAALEAARFYLRQGADSDGTTLYRLFHQGLADHLKPPGCASAVLDRLLTEPWESAPPYVRRHAIQYAAEAGRVDELLRMPGFLAHADPGTLDPELESAAADDTRLAAAIYRASTSRHRSLEPSERAQILAIDAARYGAGDVLPLPARTRWTPRWATGGQIAPALHGTLQVADGTVHDLASADLDGRAVVAAAVERNPPSLWDLESGTPISERLGDSTATAVAFAVVAGRDVVVTGDPLGSVRVLDATDGRPLGPELMGHTGRVTAVACAGTRDRSYAVTASEDGTVRAWDLTAMRPLGPLPVPGASPNAGRPVACIERDGTVLAATTADAWVVVCELPSGTEVARHPVTAAPDEIALGTVRLEERQAILVAGGSGVLLLDGPAPRTLWRPDEHVATGTPLVSGGNGTAVVVHPGGLMRLFHHGPNGWMPASTAHGTTATAAACATVPRLGTLAVTGGPDGRLRLWDPADAPPPVGRPRPAHLTWVSAVETARVAGETAVVSADHGGAVLLHRADSGERLATVPEPPGEFLALWSPVDGPPVGLFRDETDRRLVWTRELGTPGPSRDERPLEAGAEVTAAMTLRLGGDDVAVLGRADGQLETWDLKTGRPRLRPPAADATDSLVRLAAASGVGGRGMVIALSASGRVTVRDVAAARPAAFAIGRGTDATAIACVRVRHRPALLTGHQDGGLWSWDPRTGEEGGPLRPGHGAPVTAIACGRSNGTPLAVTAGEDATLRVWDLHEMALTATVALPEPAQRLTVSRDGTIIAAMNWEIVVFADSLPGELSIP